MTTPRRHDGDDDGDDGDDVMVMAIQVSAKRLLSRGEGTASGISHTCIHTSKVPTQREPLKRTKPWLALAGAASAVLAGAHAAEPEPGPPASKTSRMCTTPMAGQH